MGRNGAGKSTTMKSIMGLLAKRAGAVHFNGDDISAPQSLSDRAPRSRLSRLRTAASLSISRSRKISISAASRSRYFHDGKPVPVWTPQRLYKLFPNLAEMTDRPGGRMSGGEQQMLTVARTLMGNPLLVLLDEPSEGVAPVIVEQMANTIVELKKEGLSILLSEQNVHFAQLVSDRVYLLEKGQIRWSGPKARARRQCRTSSARISTA